MWLTLFVVTLLHEFAHGLTCKHYDGEVHEVGFLCVFFMPCFYCNVSDAWLFKEKSTTNLDFLYGYSDNRRVDAKAPRIGHVIVTRRP